MSEVFLKVVNMSISAGWLVLAILALRLILKKAPKWVNVLLWGIVAVRLICPLSIESALSLIPSTETISPEIMMDWTPEISTGIAPLDQVVNPVISTSFAPKGMASANPLQILIPVAANLWLLGVLILLAYTAISYLTLRRKLRTAVILRENIFQCETVSSPFVLGILKPRIYLPYAMDGKNLNHVVAHEQAHIRRKDYWWKPLAFLLLTVYWFNPLMWVAYILLCRDIELACDEKVIAELGNEQRADYTQALVACAVNRRMIAACPLAFGEIGVKERVKSVMNHKKPTFWIVVAALVVCGVVAVCFLTNPLDSVDYLKFTGWSNDPRTPDQMNFEINLGNRTMSGEIYVEQWTNGTCVRSAPVVMTPFVDSIHITVRDRWDAGEMVGTEIHIETNQYGGSLTTYFPCPEEYDGAYHYARNELNKRIKLSPDQEVILEARSFQCGNGIRPFNCKNLITNRELLDSQDCILLIKAVFSDDPLGVTNESEVSPPTEMLTLNDVMILSQKGYDLTWSDFDGFDYIETGSGLYIRVYEINDLFQLMIGGGSPYSDPMYIYLKSNDGTDERIDIRDGGVTDFISEHNGHAGDFSGIRHMGLNAEIVDIDYDQKILYVKDIDESDAVFGDRCAIDCGYAISRNDLLYVNYGDPNDVRTIDFSTFAIGDTVILNMYESEKEKAFSGSAVVEQVQLSTQRLNSELVFEFNFAGNTSGGQQMELTEDKPYWCITIVNEGTNGITIDVAGTIYMVDAGKKGHIYPDKAWDSGTYPVSFGTSGGSGMEGYAICSISATPFPEEEPLAWGLRVDPLAP